MKYVNICLFSLEEEPLLYWINEKVGHIELAVEPILIHSFELYTKL